MDTIERFRITEFQIAMKRTYDTAMIWLMASVIGTVVTALGLVFFGGDDFRSILGGVGMILGSLLFREFAARAEPRSGESDTRENAFSRVVELMFGTLAMLVLAGGIVYVAGRLAGEPIEKPPEIAIGILLGFIIAVIAQGVIAMQRGRPRL